MVDASGASEAEGRGFAVNVPVETRGFFLKGCAHLGYGMKSRLARIFEPSSGRTVMLAFDHGYIMGPTSGLERLDLAIPPLIPHADSLMCTRGALAACVPPEARKPVVLRCGSGATVLKELSDEVLAVDLEDAVRLGAAAVTTMVYVGGVHEKESLHNMSRLINAGNRFGIPALAVTAVGKDMARDARYLGLACRVAAEIGAAFVKTYFCEPGFDEVVAGCPVPVVIAGGKKLPEAEALAMAYRAVDQGAAGVDMGRNIFLSEDPVAMIRAVRAVVHDLEKPEAALELFRTLKNERRAQGARQ
ncbi:MAG: 3-hydroxy-5-phosphonooxypentane-2,4-dione thiolase [Planctomycetes bacterium]|nr:3-hydroxy-5-phosphonooxypentane-2,4-dione thiolase [Planctomycetota bacterium]